MLRRLAQQRMTLSDLKWLFYGLRAISVVAELLVYISCNYSLARVVLFIDNVQMQLTAVFVVVM